MDHEYRLKLVAVYGLWDKLSINMDNLVNKLAAMFKYESELTDTSINNINDMTVNLEELINNNFIILNEFQKITGKYE